MRAESPTVHLNEYQVACGKKRCIVFYKGSHCLFCIPANEILKDVLIQFGVSDNAIHEIDIGQDDEIGREEGIVALPTIEICNECIVGLPEEGIVRDAMVKALMQECFSDE